MGPAGAAGREPRLSRGPGPVAGRRPGFAASTFKTKPGLVLYVRVPMSTRPLHRTPRLLLGALVLFALSCGGGGDGKTPVPGRLLDKQSVVLGTDMPKTLALGSGEQAVMVRFPPHATTSQEPVEVALSQGVMKEGATPAGGTVIQIITVNIIFTMPAVLTQTLPPAPPGKIYAAATAAPGDKAWTVIGPARAVGAAPAGDKMVFEIDVRGTGLWTIVLVDAPSLDAGRAPGMMSGPDAGASGNNDARSSDVGGPTGAAGDGGGQALDARSSVDGNAADAATPDTAPTPPDAAPAAPDVAAPVGPAGMGAFTQITAGFEHVCALKPDGTASCWGGNAQKQATPPSAGKFSQVASGGFVSCGLRAADKAVVCWGFGSGYGTLMPPAEAFTEVAVGGTQTTEMACGLKTDSTPICWGYPGSGKPPSDALEKLAGGPTGFCGLKKSDGSLVCWGGNVTTGVPSGAFARVSIGGGHACAVTKTGTVECWGSGGAATAPGGQGFTEVAAGGQHACAVRNGAVTCWGENSNGQSAAPRGTFAHLSAGNEHTCALQPDGGVVCWGSVKVLPEKLTKLSVASDHICGIRADGTLSCWGNNDYKQSAPPIGTFKELSVFGAGSCGVRSDGSITCWGGNDPGMVPAGTFDRVAAGPNHACGLKDDKTVVCWGNVPDLNKAPSGTFVDLSLSSGGLIACAVKTDGALACWGQGGGNSDAVLKPPAGAFSQVSVSDIGSFACARGKDGNVACWGIQAAATTAPNGAMLQVAAGGSHSCGIWSDGLVTCWGDNSAGQSALLEADLKAVQIAAAGSRSCAIDAANRASCWGDFIMRSF